MARTISAASLAKLATNKGTEPVVIIEVSWKSGAPAIMYADKEYSSLGVRGKILEVDNLESIINVNKSGTSQSVGIRLDDNDGSIKNIINNADIHKRTVWVWQWFDGIPLSDRFLIFRGQISSPITWRESDRTVSFDIVSQVEDLEVGFSAEEGAFDFVPQNLLGKAWPLVFGTVQKVPCIQLDEIVIGSGNSKVGGGAESILKDPLGIESPTLEKQIGDKINASIWYSQVALLYFIGYLQASHTARRLGELGDLDDISVGNGTFSGLAQQYLDLGNDHLLQSQQASREAAALSGKLAEQKTHNRKTVGITDGDRFPQNRSVSLDVRGAKVTGVFTSDQFRIDSVEHPDIGVAEGFVIPGLGNTPTLTAGDVFLPSDEDVVPKIPFHFADAGTPIKLHLVQPVLSSGGEQTNPVRYIVSGVLNVTVQAVYAKRSVNGVKLLLPVPSSYYNVFNVDFGSIPATIIRFDRPLSSRGDDWEDDVWATVTSAVGPNTVDIMTWIIDNFTSLDWDPTTFNAVKASIQNYPSHFALTDKPQAIQLLQDIAYQARCILWINNGIFYLKYLAKEETPVETITETDVIFQSMEMTGTETEDLVTKYVAEWKADLYTDQLFKIILRHNVRKYGTHEKVYKYFIYNQQQLVEKSATFWLIRQANTYKRVRFRTPITKLKIETLDTITLNFANNYVATGSVVALVESARFDSSSYEIELECWVPVRFGEMVKYPFAFPADLTAQFIYPTPQDEEEGVAGGDGPGKDATLPTSVPVDAPADLANPFSGDIGNGGSLHITRRPYDWGADPSYVPDTGNQSPTIITRVDSTDIKPVGKPKSIDKYAISQNKQDLKKPVPVTSGVFPGRIVSGQGTKYVVDVYFKGLKNKPTQIEEVIQLQIEPNEQIPKDTWVMVTRSVWEAVNSNKQTEIFVEMTIQCPVWL